MKPTLEIEPAIGQRYQITLTPTHATVSVPRGISDYRRAQIRAFAEYILEQFVDVTENWTGLITFHLDCVTFAKTVLRAGLRTRRYEAVV